MNTSKVQKIEEQKTHYSFRTSSSKSLRNLAEASSAAACWRLKRSSSLTASASRNCRITPFLLLRGGGPAEVDGSTHSWLSEPDSVASSSSTVAWLWTVGVEPLPAVAESIRVGGSIDGLPQMASCMAVKYGHVAAVASPLSVPDPVGGHLNSYKNER